MSGLPSDTVFYGSANMPEADSVTVGGAVDFTKRIAFYDISPAGTVNAVSSSASDTATKLQVSGRDATGVIQTPAAITLNGTTPVTGIGSSQNFERLLAAVITGGAIAGLANPGGTAAVGDVALYANTAVINAHTAQTGAANASGTTPALFKLQSGDGVGVSLGQIIRIKTNTGINQLRQIIATSGYGTDIVAVNRNWGTVPDNTSTYDVYQGILFEILPNPVTAVTRCFATAAADAPGGSSRTYYEKVFVVNNNTATALLSATVQDSSNTPTLSSGGLLDLALCKALNDAATAANRQTLPANGDATGLTFVTQPSAVSVIAGSGQLPSGSAPNSAGAQGVWLRLTLPAGTAAYKGGANLRIQGTTT
jgi:hypothetical protein